MIGVFYIQTQLPLELFKSLTICDILFGWYFQQLYHCTHSWYFLWLKIWVTESTMIQRVAFKTSTCGQKEKTWSITRSKDAQNPVIIIYARSSFSHPDLGYHLGSNWEPHRCRLGVTWVPLACHLGTTWVSQLSLGWLPSGFHTMWAAHTYMAIFVESIGAIWLMWEVFRNN